MRKFKYINLTLILIISLFLNGCHNTTTKKETTSTSTTSSETTTISVTTKELIHLELSNSSEKTINYYQSHKTYKNNNGAKKDQDTFDIDYILNNYSSDEVVYAISFLLNQSNICIPYGSKTNEQFPIIDEDPDHPGNILLFYSQVSVKEYSQGIHNKEHVWCQSLGHRESSGSGAKVIDGATVNIVGPGASDLYNIRPTYATINSTRNNSVYGYAPNDARVLKYPTNQISGYYTTSIFEPVDSVKGDVARILFYYSIKYNYPLSIIVSDDTYKEILEWNRLDPVSQIEINRNNAIQDIQGNRNIFVDYPELAEYIWG